MSIDYGLTVAALVCFILAACAVPTRVNTVALGLTFLTLTLLV